MQVEEVYDNYLLLTGGCGCVCEMIDCGGAMCQWSDC